MLKKTLIGLAAVIALFIIIGLALPGKLHVERSISINTDYYKIDELILTTKNWEKWSPWQKMDPNMKITYFGPERGEGAGYSWESEDMGNGKLTIKEQGKTRTTIAMNFMEDKSETYSYFEMLPLDTVPTELTWGIDMDCKINGGITYITGGYMKLIMNYFMKKHFDDGLANLKAEAEKN